MSTTQRNGNVYHLPETAPDVINDQDARGSEFLPWALYSIDSAISQPSLHLLAAELEQEHVVEVASGDDIHLIRPAPASSLYQSGLELALKTHIQYGNANKTNLEYFPYGFLVAHDQNWSAEGLWIVHVDFEEGNPVTSFRLKAADVGGVCFTLREDDEGIEVLKGYYQINN